MIFLYSNLRSYLFKCGFIDRNYLISEIHGVLKYSSEIHKIIKLENHEGNEITVEELVDQYYKDPDKYFEVSGNKCNAASPGGGTALAISKTCIMPLENKNKTEGVSDEYSFDAKNSGKLQQLIQEDVKSIQSEHEESTKYFDLCSSNNFLIFNCYYCKYQTNIEREYEHHVVLRHPGKLAYPSKMDLEKLEIMDISIDRKEQGRILAQMNSAVKRNSETSYTVSSQSGKGSYDVNNTQFGWNCSFAQSH